MSHAGSVQRVDALLHPRSIAVVGANAQPGSWSATIFEGLRVAGFDGPVYPVNPSRQEIWGVPCFPDLAALPNPPDQVAAVVSADKTIGVVDDAVRVGARSVVAYASGFGEDGHNDGAERGATLTEVARSTDLAICGPNCMGYVSTSSKANTFPGASIPETDFAAVIGQSGGITGHIVRELHNRCVGVSYAVNSGNELGLTIEDYLEYFLTDPRVKVIGAFVETMKDPDRFYWICRRLSLAGKPVVVVKVGRTERSQQSATTHTGRLAGSWRVFEGVTRAAGVVLVDDIDELIDTISCFRSGRFPLSGRAVALCLSGGLKGLVSDLGERHGLEFVELLPETEARISSKLGPGTAVGNPLDLGMTGVNEPDVVADCVEEVLHDDRVSSIVIQGTVASSRDADTMRSARDRIQRLAEQHGDRHILFVSLGARPWSDYFRESIRETPSLAYVMPPGMALKALGRLARYSEWHHRTSTEPVATTTTALREGSTHFPVTDRSQFQRVVLDEVQSKQILSSYGLPLPEGALVKTVDEARQVARRIGYPVVVKGVSPDIVHKTERGMVVTNVFDDDALTKHVKRIEEQFDHGETFSGILVEKEAESGIECAVGLTRDPESGLVMMFGAGGLGIELYEDIAFGRVARSHEEAKELIAATTVGRLILAARGRSFSPDSLIEALRAISSLVDDLGDSVESLDVNPIRALAEDKGVRVLDATLVTKGRLKR